MLADWLDRLERRNRDRIVLGLDRVRAVRQRLGLHPHFPLITVGGTNGKGSTCAFLESMLSAAGYKVGCYTSPHLLRYNERVRIDGREVSDEALCASLEAVETARGDIPLTYFEQGTLAAMHRFLQAGLDVAVLEVGLGGRLDAVNAWDTDCAVITSVDLDHQSFLGDDRESIGYEKAGIMRTGKPAICGDARPPSRLLEHAGEIGAGIWRMGRDITVEYHEHDWLCRVPGLAMPALPRPAMPGRHQYGNAACALAALASVRERLPVSLNALRLGVAAARQPGRFQLLGRTPTRILDVAHNPHAARALADSLADLPPGGTLHGVFSVLADKDFEGVVKPLLGRIRHWHVAGLDIPRGLSTGELKSRIAALGGDATGYVDIAEAWWSACRLAGPADTIVAFGSFHTVAGVLQATSGERPEIHD
ncbi:MAG TPA: bifunctional tetrahydrofolate synthase/dihydrofolate synthase [Thiobacillaceae bacterium]|nr:bifunctional tetrahydrofolate synthase/dihydrofolate synthase [Thiobacillaceae bacterium]